MEGEGAGLGCSGEGSKLGIGGKFNNNTNPHKVGRESVISFIYIVRMGCHSRVDRIRALTC